MFFPVPTYQLSLNSDSPINLPLYLNSIPEQQTHTQEQFGVERVYEIVAASPSAEEDVNQLLAAVTEWAGHEDLDDDTTIVSLGLV